MIYTSNSLKETEVLAKKFVEFLKASPDSNLNVIGFSGDLGSGKTAFTKAVAAELGILEHVTSPTFVIQKRYPIALADFPYKNLIHIDAYRLESAKELENIRFKEEAQDTSNLFLIEWPEKVLEALPENTPIIRFSFVSEDVRTIEFPAMMAV